MSPGIRPLVFLGLCCGTVAPILYAATVVWGGGLFDGYSHFVDPISGLTARGSDGSDVLDVLTGKFRNKPEVDLETWFIPGGAAGAALYTFLQPGIYAYVNHNLIEAVELGATAHIMVEGTWDDDLMTQLQAPTPIG